MQISTHMNVSYVMQPLYVCVCLLFVMGSGQSGGHNRMN